MPYMVEEIIDQIKEEIAPEDHDDVIYFFMYNEREITCRGGDVDQIICSYRYSQNKTIVADYMNVVVVAEHMHRNLTRISVYSHEDTDRAREVAERIRREGK